MLFRPFGCWLSLREHGGWRLDWGTGQSCWSVERVVLFGGRLLRRPMQQQSGCMFGPRTCDLDHQGRNQSGPDWFIWGLVVFGQPGLVMDVCCGRSNRLGFTNRLHRPPGVLLDAGRLFRALRSPPANPDTANPDTENTGPTTAFYVCLDPASSSRASLGTAGNASVAATLRSDSLSSSVSDESSR